MKKILVPILVLAGLLMQPRGLPAQESLAPTVAPLGKAYVYRTIDGRDLHAYVAIPSTDFQGPRPAFVVFHGGGFQFGGPQLFNPQSAYLVKLGIVTVEIEYRFLNDHTSVVDCFSDARSAIRWVRANSHMLGVDPRRIVAAGGSAGGYLAAADAYLSGVRDPGEDVSLSTVPNALILYNPALDGEPGSVLARLLGDRYVELSPYLHIPTNAPDKGYSPAVLILSGGNDTTIGVDDLVDFQRRLKRAGASAKLLLYPGQEHGFYNAEPYLSLTNAAVAHFLQSLGYIKDVPIPEPPALPGDLQPRVIQ